MNIPMREKYVDEIFGFYYKFGSSEDGKVDVCSNQQDLITVPEDIADQIIQHHADFRKKIYKLLCQ